jgi:zinc protease
MTVKLHKALLILFCLAAASYGSGWPKEVSAMPQVQRPVHRMVLPNQLVILVYEENSLPFVTFYLLTDSGSWRDPAGREGLANLTSEGLLLGTDLQTVSELNERLDFMGSRISTSCDRDYATMTFRSLTKNLEEGVNLFLEVLTRPAFPEREIERKVEEIQGRLKAEEDDPGEVAEKAFHRELFGEGPYAHPVQGTLGSLSEITRGSVVEFYRTHYRPQVSILAVVGDITLDTVKEKLIPSLSTWSHQEVPEGPSVSQGLREDQPGTVKIDRPITQANIRLGHEGIERSHPDYYAVFVMNNILGGGGFGSRLMEEIRIKRGLAYAVLSHFLPHKRLGTFQIILQTKNESAGEAVSVALQQVERMQKEMVSEEELETAKRFLIGSFPLRLTTQMDLARFYAQVEYYGIGLDYPERYSSLIRSVTREDVQRAAKEYLHPQRMILSIVADMRQVNLEGADRLP